MRHVALRKNRQRKKMDSGQWTVDSGRLSFNESPYVSLVHP